MPAMNGEFHAVVLMLKRIKMAALAQSTAALVPVVGWFIGSFVGMYLMLCHGRLLGLFYRQYQSKLGW